MKVFVTGNMGYVGPVVVRHLRDHFPDAFIHGFDNAYFAHCLTGARELPERLLDRQSFGDIRAVSSDLLDGYDSVIHLAAVSNDPMGNCFSAVTRAINCDAALELARSAAAAGVANFVFASSCSVYGMAGDEPREEGSRLEPVTAYAASKIATEEGLKGLNGDMVITCLRFATACGMSDRLRLDLVLNDFVACALASGEITVLSDGSPWRPLIDVADMARALEWAATRTAGEGGRYLVVNVGTDERNHRIRDLAYAVAEAVPGTEVSINTDAAPDSRSYRVDFGRFAALAPGHQPQVTLEQSIAHLVEGLTEMGFADPHFRTSRLVRLHVLKDLIARSRLSDDLVWLQHTNGLGAYHGESGAARRRPRHEAERGDHDPP